MSEIYRQNQVSRTVWPWQGTENVRKSGPSLTFSLVTLAIALGVAALFYAFGHTTMTFVVVGISLVIFICGQFFPPAYARIEQLFQKLSHLVGQGLTWLFLVPFFYICFGSGRLVQKMAGKDPMKRALDSQVATYWQDRNQEKGDKEQYRRQF